MLHPLFHLIANQPHLLGDHAQAYGELIGTELSGRLAALKRRTMFAALALCMLVVSVALAGVALMLWVTVGPHAPTTSWVLVLVPAVPTALAIACYLLARTPGTEDPAFAELRRQVEADLALLRSMNT